MRQEKRRQNQPAADEPLNFKPNDQIVGKDTLANLMEVSISSIDAWIVEGLPVDQQGDLLHDWLFNFSDVKNWISKQQ